jgi:hypothetical protein
VPEYKDCAAPGVLAGQKAGKQDRARIDAGFRELAQRHHPDRGGKKDDMQVLIEARAWLRLHYDDDLPFWLSSERANCAPHSHVIRGRPSSTPPSSSPQRRCSSKKAIRAISGGTAIKILPPTYSFNRDTTTVSQRDPYRRR